MTGNITEIRSWSSGQRAAHYQNEADQFRRMAEAEPVEKIRRQLLTLADQYQNLAISLLHPPA